MGNALGGKSTTVSGSRFCLVASVPPEIPPEVVWEAVLAGNMVDRSILHKLRFRRLLQHALTCGSWSLLQRRMSIGIFYKWGN